MTTSKRGNALVLRMSPEEIKEHKKEQAKKGTAKYRTTEKFRISYVESHLQRTYGLSMAEYFSLYEMQDQSCAICKNTDCRRSAKNRRNQYLPLFVDHDHKTGKVRGLLCSKCNSGLGMFTDSIDLLTNAISYLKV